eukprot:scaffold36945_cov42-Cyclotella_meneghiniana.AAC.2
MLQATELMAQMRQEMMDSLRAELRSEFQSRVDHLEDKCDLLLQENADLKRECKLLKKKQLREEAKVSQLQGEVSALKKSAGKAERKAKYLEVVKKNENWEYPHDMNMDEFGELLSRIGYDDEESTLILDAIDQLKDDTIKMRRGEPMDFTVDRGELSYYNEEMLPYFQEFAHALSEYRHTVDYMDDEIFSFSLNCAGLPNEVLDVLQDALHRTHFHHLSFYYNEIDGLSYIDFIANCIAADTRLEDLSLGRVTLLNTRKMDALCAALNNHQSLQHLTLDHCEIGQVGLREIFNKLKSPTLETLYLIQNGISNLMPGDISDLLSSNPSLRLLYLRDNPFNEQDIVYIADALRNNTSLGTLKLRFGAPFVLPENWHLLTSVVFDQTSLNSAHDSNHYCHLEILSPQHNTSAISKFNMYGNPVLNRRKKIYHILSTRNRNRENAAYFESDDIGIKHMPRILALLEPFSEHYLDGDRRKDDDEVEPLSIAYELLRDWKMPELYNCLDCMEED